jgi:TetR/AcrR family transcriptional repressor of nem operon
MRYSLEHKAQNHEKILSVAARTFRERGGDSSGIGTVMKKVGLKKGGFYRHFKSKDDLFVEAVARALDETGRGMEEVAKSVPEGQALRAIIERYLSAPRSGRSSHESPYPCANGLRRCWKRIVSGYRHLFLVGREKKDWRSAGCCSPVWRGY